MASREKFCWMNKIHNAPAGRADDDFANHLNDFQPRSLYSRLFSTDHSPKFRSAQIRNHRNCLSQKQGEQRATFFGHSEVCFQSYGMGKQKSDKENLRNGPHFSWLTVSASSGKIAETLKSILFSFTSPMDRSRSRSSFLPKFIQIVRENAEQLRIILAGK